MSTPRVTIASFIILLGLTPCLFATVQVGGCRNGLTSFATIQAAVTAASPGTTILVCPGTYPEQVMIDKPLTLAGVQSGTADAAVIAAPAGGVVSNTTSLASGNPIAAQVAVTGTANVHISNLTIDGANNGMSGCTGVTLVGLYYRNASGTVQHMAVANQALTGDSIGCQTGLGIYVESGNGETSVVTISHNHVHNYQKNGITGNELGTVVTISNNTVVGQGPTNGAAENSIQVGFGAVGSITSNTAADDIWAPDTISDSADAASGILVFASSNVKLTGNTVSNTQFGIAFVSDPTAGPADGGTITGNQVSATRIFDGIELCGSSNVAQRNTINGSDEAAVHIDSSCGAVANNVVSRNTINDACAGIMVGTAAGPNAIGRNTFFNVRQTMVTADQCAPPLNSAQIRARSSEVAHRASPARP
jgi:hypothetical protein